MQTPSNIAESYYNAMGHKNAQELSKYLHPDVQFIGPMSEMTGKDNVLDAAKNFMNMFNSVEIRHKFEAGSNSAMIVFDLICPEPIGKFRAATLMSIENSLITRMELFYDARPFEQSRDQIFSGNN